MGPERPKIRNEGDRQELMAEELAGGELEHEELELGRELRRPARQRPPEEIPERAAPAVETSEGSTFGVETGEVGSVVRRARRQRRRTRRAAKGGRRSSRRPKDALTRPI
ncbi:MAG: hypothetical protein HY553_01120 [Elusimicrobia bacterium]|nr:hypothetical protein [Elusimicrobiota bacterium]